MGQAEALEERLLLEGLRRKETAAGERLYLRYRMPLYTFLLASGAKDRADDILQETFLRLLDPTLEIGSIRCLKAFLFQVALNLLRDHFRKGSTRKERTGIEDLQERGFEPPSNQPAPEAAALAREESFRLQEALDRLPETLREPFVMVRLGGLKLQEVADLLNIGLSAVKMRLRRALERLAEALPPSAK